MPKKEKICTSIREALETFDLNIFKKWCLKDDPLLWNVFKIYNKEVQKSIMAKMIINRTDMLGTDAYKRAVQYLKKHNSKGGLF